MPANRPLIICDVDEVVLHFVTPFSDFLERQGLQLIKRSYALSGNIVDRQTSAAISGSEIGRLVHAFFEAETHAQPRISGASEALAELSDQADILFLTNFPDAFRDRRGQNLHDHGMPYPIHTNTGPKGKAAADLAADRATNVVFLDDIGSNLVSVGQHLPDASLIQFIGDHAFFDLAPPLDAVDLKTKNWEEAKCFIIARLRGGDGAPS